MVGAMILPKFNIKDKVWMMDDNKIVEGLIFSISAATVSTHLGSYEIGDAFFYKVVVKRMLDGVSEDNLFKTREELIASL